MPLARARTRTTRSGVQRTNHYATTSPHRCPFINPHIHTEHVIFAAVTLATGKQILCDGLSRSDHMAYQDLELAHPIIKRNTFRVNVSTKHVSPECIVLRKPRRDFRLPTSDFRLQTSDFRLQTSDFRLPTSDFRLPTSDFRLQT